MTTPKYDPQTAGAILGRQVATLRTFHYLGGLKTDAELAGEQGAHRRYSFRDLIALAVVGDLINRGISLKWAAELVEDNRKHLGEREFWLCVSQGLPDDDFYTVPAWQDPVHDWRQPGIKYRGLTRAADAIGMVMDGKMGAVSVVVAVHRIAQELRVRLRALYEP